MAGRTLKQASTMIGNTVGPLEAEAVDEMPMPRLMHPSEMEYIRVTSVQLFRDCPRQWALTYLAPPGVALESESASAGIGTAAHEICEQYLLGIHTGQYDQAKANAAYTIIPEHERQNVHEYAESLRNIAATKPLFIEERVRMQIIPGMPQISGQMDFVTETHDGLLIVDHKTNRGYEPADVWRTKLQPMLYMYMARKLWPGYNKYIFQIGYINLNLTVQWESDLQDDIRVEQILTQVWADMQKCASTGYWPMTINDSCQWCPLKSICPEYQNTTKGLRNSLVDVLTKRNEDAGQPNPNMQEPSLYALLEHVKLVAKIVDAEKDRLEAELLIDALKHGGVGDYPEATSEIVTKERNEANTYATLMAFNNFVQQCGILPDSVPYLLDEIFTTKTTGLQKLGKEIPAFKSYADALVTKVPSEKKTLKFTAKKEQIIEGQQTMQQQLIERILAMPAE